MDRVSVRLMKLLWSVQGQGKLRIRVRLSLGLGLGSCLPPTSSANAKEEGTNIQGLIDTRARVI